MMKRKKMMKMLNWKQCLMLVWQMMKMKRWWWLRQEE
jgi:hypothetical protein